MEQGLEKQIKDIIGELQCPKQFCCMEDGHEFGCKAKDVGLEEYLECLEESYPPCPFLMTFGIKRYCHCPIRIYICKNLAK